VRTLSLPSAAGQGLPDGDWEWLWLLDDSVSPQPRALESLLDALQRVDRLPAPVLLASKVVTPDGSLDPASLPIPQVLDSDLAVTAFELRLLSLRVARRGSLLVHRRGLERWGLPDERPGDIEWTARLLKHEPGLLVPDSVAVRRPAAGGTNRQRARAEAAGLLRLVLGDALEPREKPWFAYRLAERAAAALRTPR
jgi:hypothetical protein